jgi:hypothetical protein
MWLGHKTQSVDHVNAGCISSPVATFPSSSYFLFSCHKLGTLTCFGSEFIPDTILRNIPQDFVDVESAYCKASNFTEEDIKSGHTFMSRTGDERAIPGSKDPRLCASVIWSYALINWLTYFPNVRFIGDRFYYCAIENKNVILLEEMSGNTTVEGSYNYVNFSHEMKGFKF